MTNPYIGRFAPSPTGPLHFGSLVTAVASYLDARQAQGQWRVRIEDLDPPREVPGAAAAILRTLEAFALHWDGPVVYQSQRQALYRDALQQLHHSGWLFPCGCSRREIAEHLATSRQTIYPGTCRAGLAPGRRARLWRVRVDERSVAFNDRAQGLQQQNLSTDVGDFIVQRADGMTAYQLAVVVDDADQGITDVVRGSDLLASTPRQIYLQQRLDFVQPRYLHCPVAVNARGEKLSKQTHAAAIPARADLRLACRILAFLEQPVPPEVAELSLEQLWQQAARDWLPQRFSGVRRRTQADR